jgi:hypothetical protein
LIPTATAFLHDSAMEAHSSKESPLTTLMPSLELKENHAGIFMSSSSKSLAYAYTKQRPSQRENKHNNELWHQY